MDDTDRIIGLPPVEHRAAFDRVLARMTGAPSSSSGTTIGRYQLVRRLGVGGMGLVYLVRDPDLDRMVALKVLHARLGLGSGSDAFPRRMRREARAMAQLDHPNVVRVHEVGEHDGRTFLVMELVEGTTLRQWIDAEERSWEEVVRTFVAAGRGLAAAHAAGLVHCDFKPDNVLMGADGAIKVGDFGLVRAQDDGADERAPTARVEDEADAGLITREGELFGTPAYMAPEQLDGRRGGPRSDQFSFCVALYRALYGQAPFPGRSVSTLRAAMDPGPLPVPEMTRSVPSELEHAIGRGLRVDPGERWASMDELLARLERVLTAGTRRRRRWVLGTGGLIVLLGVGTQGVEQLREAQRAEACAREGAVIDERWDDQARAAVRDGLLATGARYAIVTADEVLPRLDRYAEQWRAARVEVCTRASVDRSFDAPTTDRARWCLDAKRHGLEALVGQLASADLSSARNAVEAVTNLPLVMPCVDPIALASLPAPPVQRRARLAPLRAELARVAALEAGGQYDAALELSTGLLVRAEQMGWMPLTAEVRRAHAQVLRRTGDYDAALREGIAAFSEASGARAWSVAIEAANHNVLVAGHRMARHDEARAWSSSAEAMAVLAGDPDGMRRADRLSALGVVENDAGRHAEAKAMHEEALALFEASLGPEHLGVAHSLDNLANSNRALGEVRRARALYERGLGILERVYGPEHPRVSHSLNNLAVVHWALGEHARAKQRLERVVEIRRAALGPEHPDVARARTNLGAVLEELGDHATAARIFEDVLRFQERTVGPEHPDYAAVCSNLAVSLMELGELDRAAALHEHAVAIFERTLGPEHPNVAQALSNLGIAERQRGRLEPARRALGRALEILELTTAGDPVDMAGPLEELAVVAIEQDDAARAISLAERAVALRERSEGSRRELGRARFLLARASVDTRPRYALEHAHRAAEELRGADGADELRDEVERWLAARAATRGDPESDG